MKLPAISQLGIIVKDIETSIRNYSKLTGINHWYQAQIINQTIFYRDEPINLELDLVVGYSGKVQFELIQVLGGDQNIYTDLIQKQQEGLHHVGYVVSDIEAGSEAFRACGFSPLQQGTLETKGRALTRFVYFDTFDTYGYYIELIQTTLFGINVGMSSLMMKLGRLFGDVTVYDL